MAEPIANWMMSLNASTALETLADFAEQAEKTLDWIDQRAKSIDLAAGFKDSTRDILDSLKQIDMAVGDLGKKAGTLRFGIDTGKAESSLEDLARKTTDFAADAGPKTPEVYGPPRPPRAEPAPRYSEPIGPKQWDERRVKGMFDDLEQYGPKKPKAPSFEDDIRGADPKLKDTLRGINEDLTKTEKSAKGVGAALDAAFRGAGRFGDLRNQLKGLDVLFHTNKISASMAQDAIGRITDEATRRIDQQKTSLQELKFTSLGMFATGAYMVRGLTQTGFAGTGEEAVSQHYKQQLGRQFAGIAAPLKMENAGRIAELTDWFKKLNGEQQESIRNVAIFATSMTTLGVVLPRVVRGIQAMTAAQLASNAAGAAGGIGKTAGIGAGLGPLGMVGAVGISMLASTKEGRDALVEVAKAFEPAIKSLMDVVQEMRPAIRTFADAVKELALLAGKLYPTSPEGRHVAGATAENVGAGPSWSFGLSGMRALSALRNRFDPTTTNDPERRRQLEANRARWLGNDGYLSFLPQGIRNWFGNRPPQSSSPRSDVTGMPGGFEAIEQTWMRITEAATRVDLQARATAAAEAAIPLLTEMVNQGRNIQTGFHGFEKTTIAD